MLKSASIVQVLLFATALFGQTAEPLFVRDAVGLKSFPPPPRIAERAAAGPLVTLGFAASSVPDEIEAVYAWNDKHGVPAKNGFTRHIPGALAVRLGTASASTTGERFAGGIVTTTAVGTRVWSAAVRVAGAYRLRLHLTNVSLPPGAVFWVYPAAGTPVAFDHDLIDDHGELYTPSVAGEMAYLELEVPQNAEASFDISDVLEIVPPRVTTITQSKPAPADAPTCLIDATCVTSSTLDAISDVERAVADLHYVKAGTGYVCTGALLNDKDTSTSIPYLLTANHCFSDQSAASSLEAFWDYRTSTCGGTFPDRSTLQRTNGSQLLATSATSDFTFVKLSGIPAGRWLLGWTTTAVPAGTVLHRISHPFPDAFSTPAPQAYSSTIVNTTVGTCSGQSRSSFIYSNGGQGGVYGGSSGSPAILTGGYVVGQLFGSCGPNDPSAGCDPSNATVDGAFSVTYPSIASYLSGNSGVTPTPCVASSTTACLLNNRFKATVRYRNGGDNGAADTDAFVKTVTGFASVNNETSFFYFYGANNIELLLKMLDQGNTNSSGQPTIAVLFGSATPLRFELTITDTQTSAVKRYTSQYASQVGQTDFSAFVK